MKMISTKQKMNLRELFRLVTAICFTAFAIGIGIGIYGAIYPQGHLDYLGIAIIICSIGGGIGIAFLVRSTQMCRHGLVVCKDCNRNPYRNSMIRNCSKCNERRGPQQYPETVSEYCWKCGTKTDKVEDW